MRRLGIRARLTLTAVGVLALGLLVVSTGINLLLDTRLDADAASTLRSRTAAQLATIEVRGGAIVIEDRRAEGALDQSSWIFAADGSALEHAPAAPEVLAAVAQMAATTAPAEREVASRIRLRAVPVHGPGGERAGSIVVGLSLVPYHHSQNIALVGTIALSLLFLALAAFAVRRAVGSALEPVAEMTRRAADWGEQDLHHRFDVGPARDELATLADTFNGLLGRIEGVLRHEQRFSAEMAHELRTPLTGLRAEAELALASATGEPELRHALERILEGTRRMTGVIETLLTSARADGAAPRGSCDPAGPMREAAAAVRAAAHARGVQIGVSAPAGAAIHAPADVVAHALGPLLENAVRHAASRVDLRFRARPGEVVIVVTDDGPGVGADDAEAIFGPGVSTTAGAGLGLPLARRLARSGGGDLVAIPGAGGGRFELTLPSGPSLARPDSEL